MARWGAIVSRKELILNEIPFTGYYYADIPDEVKKYFKETPVTSQHNEGYIPNNSGEKKPRSISIQFANEDIVADVKESLQNEVESVFVYADHEVMNRTKQKLEDAGLLDSGKVKIELHDTARG